MNDKVHLLLIDDEKNYLLVLETLLTEAGYAVTALNDPETALAFLEESEVDIVITDMKMPRISGREVLERVKKNWPHIPVLIMTAFGSIESAVEAMRYGAFNYITKPFSNDELLLSIQNAAELARAHRQYQLLRESLEERYGKHQIIGRSRAIRDMLALVDRAGPSRATVLITGESGTGKELVSAAIHQASPRANGPFITINCGALDENLLMDTLFGHVKGAFTEARQPRKGAFLTAEGGTLMLDEIGNAAPKVQQALLRALSTRMIRPLGSDEDVPFDTRIIAATNAELLQDAQEGSFREDLYYRLAVITIRTPPLRRRKSDLPLLAVFFLTRAAESQGLPTPRLSRGALRKLQEYHWPGNVRELQNCLTRALAFCENGLIFAENIQLGPDTLPGDIARPERGKLSCPPARADNRQPHSEASETAEPPAVQPAPAGNGEQPPAAEDAPPRLNARLARLLPRLVELGSISRQEYQDMAGKDISMRTAQYDLQTLVRLGLVRREGRGPAQRYIVLPAARGFRA